MEIHEGIVSRGVGIPQRYGAAGRFGRAGMVGTDTDDRMPAGRALACRIVAHILHVTTPTQTRGAELIGQRLDARGINAATLGDDLTVRGGTRLHDIVVVAH